jgi:molybdopterin molybdotransferase
VIEDLPAGFISEKDLRPGQAIRIMTGAPIPKGADTVVPVEETQKDGSFVLIFKAIPFREHIRKAGEDAKQGDRVISKGDILRPLRSGCLLLSGAPLFLFIRGSWHPLYRRRAGRCQMNRGGSKIVSSNLHPGSPGK